MDAMAVANTPSVSEAQLAAATLACLPHMTPSRLSSLLERSRGPVGALRAVRHGWFVPHNSRGEPLTDLAAAWSETANGLTLGPLLEQRGTAVFLAGDDGYPITDGMEHPPPVLLTEGARLDAFDRPRVAIVGTRAASPHGLADATELGTFLARHSVTVVSGLAIGIDAAAHIGALDGGGTVIGVVATGLDVVYPRRHRVLFDRVREQGLIVSETGFGVAPAPSRFPVRNRIIAGLADVVVVVEATRKGGARITAERALEYDRPVLAIPGSRRNPSAEGCNALLADGAHPLLEPEDVLLALGLTPGVQRGWRGAGRKQAKPGGLAARVLRAFGGEAASVDQLATRTGATLDDLTLALHQLDREGWAEHSRGLWWPRDRP